MVTSMQELSARLTEMEIKHDVKEDQGFIGAGFNTKTYRDADGGTGLTLIIAP